MTIIRTSHRRGRLLWSALVFTALIIVAVVFHFGQTDLHVPISSGHDHVASVPVSSLGGECIECHLRTTPGIVHQHAGSAHAVAAVTCEDCHVVEEDHFAAIDHEGYVISSVVTSAMCNDCHQAEVAQFMRSRHALPAYVAMVGTEGLTPSQLEMYHAVEEHTAINTERNALFHIEGPEITRFACEGCHNIGRPFPDDSVGTCTACHLRHEYDLAQARAPETCGACHIGPDHPQWEIFQESPHGIAYQINGDDYNMDAEPGTLTSLDIPAATCATCHISGFGTQGTSHDVGERLTWFLFQPVSERRPGWQENGERMQQVCRECHSSPFVEEFYEDADVLVERINELVREGQAIYGELTEHGLTTPELFDQPIDFVMFDLWHHWGRTAKFGAWMQGPDYTQWHGAYEMVRELAHLREMSHEMLSSVGVTSEINTLAASALNY